jgi:hypothetical protein
MKHLALTISVALASLVGAPAVARPGPNPPVDQRTITLQGLLSRDGVPLAGTQLLEFRIYDAPTGGNIVFVQQKTVSLIEGRFSVHLDFPEELLSGMPGSIVAVAEHQRWWSVTVVELPGVARSSGAGSELPRQLLTAVPQALFARRSEGLQFGSMWSTAPNFLLEPTPPPLAANNEGVSMFLLSDEDLVLRARDTSVPSNPDRRLSTKVVHRLKANGDFWSARDIVAMRDVEASGNISAEGFVVGTDFIAFGTSQAANLYASNNVSGRTVTVRGADLAEGFHVRAAVRGDLPRVEPRPGLLVSIDPDNPGKLMVASEAYDRKLAGAISGANGVEAGVVLGKANDQPFIDGPQPVAMAGRVWVLADESAGEIVPGDRLTSSGAKPGFAMRVSDEQRAPGAVVGKAMTRVDPATGMVLVLVNLQ